MYVFRDPSHDGTDNLSRPLTGTLGLTAIFCAICFTAVATSPRTAVLSAVTELIEGR